ncbi:MAG: SDR family oxidoreductase [Polynucleobacter sp.]|uniref:UDP-glucose 4-epimerase family protein n=1 Tax=Polynucleobacter sp. TaxID=2029855 RepID=UPI00271684B0|nr:SDR family oxidoreductase [Polynucleobacter sp.]MDO8714704.1 SDR family oxidoreductase [Polynucleobacter sp.]
MSILVTGATGFLGRSLALHLESNNYLVRKAIRPNHSAMFRHLDQSNYAVVSNIDGNTNWTAALSGVDCVIHCAARAHLMDDITTNPYASYRIVNVDGTRSLAEQAAANGIRRFVYISSIKVNGESTNESFRFSHHDRASPEDAYGTSKWEAEQILQEISAKTGMEIVIIRPALIYGPGVKGNLGRLLDFVQRGYPMPFGAIKNQRSLIGLDNLVDLLQNCIAHPRAAGQTLLASDGEDLSTPELLRRIAKAMGRSIHLIPIPVIILKLAAKTVSKQAEINRLIGSLQVDMSHTQEILDWKCPTSLNSGIQKMVDWQKR